MSTDERPSLSELRHMQVDALRAKSDRGIALERHEFVALYAGIGQSATANVRAEIRKHGDPHKAAQEGIRMAMIEVFGALCFMAMKQQKLEERLAELEHKQKPRVKVAAQGVRQ